MISSEHIGMFSLYMTLISFCYKCYAAVSPTPSASDERRVL